MSLKLEDIERDFEEAFNKCGNMSNPTCKRKYFAELPMSSEQWQDRILRMLRPLNETCNQCSMCELGRSYTSDKNPHTEMFFNPHVFSNMNPSKWVVIGQNPGLNECLRGEPFVGVSGEKFDKTLKKFGCSRKDFYISNGVKCYTEGNSKPSTLHKDRCELFLRMELQLIRPRIVVCLGSVSFDTMCPGIHYSSNLGKIVKSDKFDVKVMPIYHPSPMNLNNKVRESIFEKDIEKLCKIINHYRNLDQSNNTLSSQ